MPGEYRKKCFEAFYCSRSWEVQTTSLAGHVKTHAVNRRYSNTSSDKSIRQNTRHYYLDSKEGRVQRVCKPMFLKTICIDCARVDGLLQKVNSCTIIDKRDRHSAAWVKLAETDTVYVKQHIKNFPTYKSHYRGKIQKKITYLLTFIYLSCIDFKKTFEKKSKASQLVRPHTETYSTRILIKVSYNKARTLAKLVIC